MSGPGESGGAQALASRTPAGRIRVGNHLLSFSREAVATVLPAGDRPPLVSRRSPRPSPVIALPLAGREEELASAFAALEAMLPVQFVGEPGTGRTSLLAHVAAGTKLPDGVVWLSGRTLPLSDLQQEIFDAVCQVEAPFKPSSDEIHDFLQRLEALIVVDDVRLPPEDVQALVNSTPHCPTVLASDEDLLWGEGRTVFLPPLPEGPAVELLELELGRGLRPDERAHAAALVDALDGRPLLLAQTGALVREAALTLREAAELLESAPTEALGAAIAQAFTERERRFLGVLASLEGVSVHPDLIEAVTGLADPVPSLSLLVRRGVAHVVRDRYSIAHPPADSLRRAVEAAWWADQMLEYLADWGEEHQRDPVLIRRESEPLLWAIDRAETKGNWPAALRLAQAAEVAVALGGLWGAWERLLVGGLEAARELEDRKAEGRFLHELGTRALCLGDAPGAELSLVTALDIEQGLADADQARATRHNLDVSIEEDHLASGARAQPVAVGAARSYRRPSPWAVARLVLVVLAVVIPVGAFLVHNVPGPGIDVAPTSLSFDTVSIGNVSKQSITLTNNGPKATSITGSFAPSAPDLSVDQGSCGIPLGPDASCTISVVFAPTSTGEVNTILKLSATVSDNVVIQQIPVTGKGAPGPGLAVNLDSRELDFGQLRVGGSESKTVTVTNEGGGRLTISTLAANPSIHDFLVSLSSCKTPLDQGQRCSISIKFQPTTIGKRSTTLSITDNATGSPHKVSLTGVGTAPTNGAAARVSPSSIGFGGITVGLVSIRKVTITNSGPDPLIISGTQISGSVSSAFESTTTCPITPLAKNGTCVISVLFEPTHAGQQLASLSITMDNGVGRAPSVPLSGIGIARRTPGVSLSSLSIDFGDIALQQTSASQPTTITNTGQAALAISSIGISSPFTGSDDCPASLTPGNRCTVTVSFTPTVLGQATATIKIKDTVGVQSVSLSGKGVQVGAPLVQLSATSVDFGEVPVGATKGESVTVTNIGTAQLQISSVTTDSTFVVDLASTCGAGTALDPNKSCLVWVDFQPLNVGQISGVLTINDDGQGSPHTVSLTGFGGTKPTP